MYKLLGNSVLKQIDTRKKVDGESGEIKNKSGKRKGIPCVKFERRPVITHVFPQTLD